MADSATDPEGSLAVALRYAACGLRVLPIKPGTKRPPMREWVDAATTNTDIVTSWYTEALYRDHGVGLALGRQPDGRMIFALDVDEHDPAHSGGETLAELQAAHGNLPDTVRSITGAGGLHLLFHTDVEVRNGVAGDGLDVRGEGGQIVVYPSIHPATKQRYEWEDGFAPWEHDIAEAPPWLVAIVHPTPAPSPAATVPAASVPGSFNDPDSPAEWLRSWWQWPGELRKAGWVEHHAARNGDTHWTRPGKEVRDGESSVLHMPGGPFVVFSTDQSVLHLRAAGRLNHDGSVSLSPFEFYAAQEHGGDLSGAARFLLSKMPGADTRLSTPTSVDDPFGGYTAQELDWDAFWRDDHSGEDWVAEPVFAARRLTVLYAPAKQGKSEVALTVVAAVATGRPILGRARSSGPRHVVYLDYEMTKGDLQERLEMLGYDEHDDLSHLHYYLLPSLPPLDTAQGAAVLRQIAAHHQAEMVVIDTMGRAVEGDENSNDTYRLFARHTGLGLKSDGVAVVRTDHAGKEREKGQRGASAKNDDADVVFRVDRVEAGWKLQRTHTRVGWVPESIVIDRTELADGRLLIELAPTTTTTYIAGTSDYVKDLKAAGITVDLTTTKAQFVAAVKPLGLSRRSKVMGDALRWMKGEIPRFSGGPTPIEPTDSRLSDDDEPTIDDVR